MYLLEVVQVVQKLECILKKKKKGIIFIYVSATLRIFGKGKTK